MVAIGFEPGQALPLAIGPLDGGLHAFGAGLTQTEDETLVMGSQEASPSGQPSDAPAFPPLDLHPGADGVPVCFRVPSSRNPIQVESWPRLFAQQQRAPVEPDQQRVGIAVVVVVADGQAAGRMTGPEDRSGPLCQVPQLSPAVIVQQQGELKVGDVSAGQLDGTGDVAVDDDQVLVAVVVVVDEANPPAHVGAR